MSIAKFLESVGRERQYSDPCCWAFYRSDRTRITFICGHVDDFLFSGEMDCLEWSKLQPLIRQRFQTAACEEKCFQQRGVRIERLENGGFCLSQPDFMDNIIKDINVSRGRAKELDSPINGHELHQLQSVLVGLSGHANQVISSAGVCACRYHTVTHSSGDFARCPGSEQAC